MLVTIDMALFIDHLIGIKKGRIGIFNDLKKVKQGFFTFIFHKINIL